MTKYTPRNAADICRLTALVLSVCGLVSCHGNDNNSPAGRDNEQIIRLAYRIADYIVTGDYSTFPRTWSFEDNRPILHETEQTSSQSQETRETKDDKIITGADLTITIEITPSNSQEYVDEMFDEVNAPVDDRWVIRVSVTRTEGMDSRVRVMHIPVVRMEESIYVLSNYQEYIYFRDKGDTSIWRTILKEQYVPPNKRDVVAVVAQRLVAA